MALIFDRMDTQKKKAVVATLLAALTAWPLLHHAVTRHYHLDPWSFFGMAMYSVPRPRLSLDVLEHRNGALKPIAETPEVLEAMIRHAKRSSYWGDWLTPDVLVGELRELQPGLGDLQIEIKRLHLDRETARFEWDSTSTRHLR